MECSNADPFDWTVDEVVNFLCRNPETPWSKSISSAPRPNPASFENALRDNLITGEVLLQDVDKDVLKDDLGLKAVGHRGSIMRAIGFLQQRSSKFQTSKSEQSFVLPSSSPLQPLPHLQHTNAHPSSVQHSSPVPPTAPSTPSLNKLPTTPAVSGPLNVGSGTDNLHGVIENSPEVNVPAGSREVPEASTSNHSRSHEKIVVDRHGRKRRRLNLTTFVESQSDDVVSEISGDEKPKSWYMGPSALTLNRVFYSSDPEGDDQTFTLVPPKLPNAQRIFVNRRLSYFFQQSPIELGSRDGFSQTAVIPYNPSMIKSTNDRFFTLYTAEKGVINPSKQRINDWPRLGHQTRVNDESQSPSELPKPQDPFSYLLQKYPAEGDSGDVFPIYGDSGSEGEFDEETWREMEEEQSEPITHQQRKLGPTEVESIIKDCVSAYEVNWRESHLPREMCKARNLWLVARRKKCVNQETKALSRDIRLLVARLQKLQEEIRKNEYTTEAELRTQCQCLEHTVFNIQKQKFRVSVLEHEKCPPKVHAPPKPRSPPKLRIGDEESLGSESDFAGSDTFDDFIVDDVGTPKVFEVENPPDTSSSSDGDDDIISVSGTRRRTRARPPKVFASSSPSISPSPSPSWPLHEKPDIIDLTMEDPDDDLRIETPPLNPVGSAKENLHDSTLPKISTSMSPPPSIGSPEVKAPVETKHGARSLGPKIDDIEETLLLDWEFLEARKDRRRLLAKLVGGLADDERTKLATHIPEYQFSKLKSLVRRALKSLDSGRVDVPGVDSDENRLIMRTASFYVAWLNCIRLGVEGIPKSVVQKALNRLDSDGFGRYYDELIERLRSCRAWKRRTEATDPDSDQEPHDTPHKRRKRGVKESQSAKMTQASAQRRVAQQEKQREKLEKRLESMGLANDNPSRQAVTFKDPIIYLNPHIGQRVKPHQLKGIQFMWRELIEDKDRQGCLLAHTMGLGKTMQVISLLTAIYEASASSDPKVSRQVPEALRPLQTLIICPSSLIDNWQDEFHMWSPKIWPMVRRVSTTDNLNARLREISAWYDDGGVLLISYNIFRRWIINNDTSKQGKPLSDADHELVKRWLLEGPNLVIADEAHKMKNASSATYIAAMQFRSTSRIALTGSPLANNLSDYYTMVNWIAEDYLGSSVEFKANYIEPIEQGLYADSTYTERRRSLMRLQVLKQILEPKINRADITVLAGDLPPKVEFVLTVPLTKLQKAAYDSYAAFVLQGRMEDVAQTQLWSWLAILGLCCNHPACFWEKLISRAQDAAAKMSDGEQQPIPGDESIDKIGIPDLGALVAEQHNLFAQVTDLKAVELSARTEIVNRILDESIKAGDKVLIFSQSLPTLNYLEYVLQASGRRYSRLDGQTPIATRQAAIKQFNRGQLQVYLISTRAGGLGLNITGANRVIIFDFSFSPTWEEQAVGRAYRLGQQKPVYVYRFLAGGTFEGIMHHKAIFKTQLSVRVVDKKNPIRFAIKKPGDYLFPAKPVTQEDVSEYIGKDKLVLDKILRDDQDRMMEDRLIRNITLTETFQREDNDKLTDEEKKSVQEEFDDENLRRRDPAAYNKRIREKQMKYMPQQHYSVPISVAHGVYQPSVPQGKPYDDQHASGPGTAVYPAQRQVLQSQVPNRAHNNGPPPLVPDMISYQPPTSTCESGAPFLFTNSPPIGGAKENAHAHATGPSFQQQMDSTASRPPLVTTSIPSSATPQALPQNTDAPPRTSSTPGSPERQKFGCGHQ